MTSEDVCTGWIPKLGHETPVLELRDF